MTLPLPPDHFRCPPLDECDREYFVNLANKAAFDCVRNAMSLQATPVVSVFKSDVTQRFARMREGPDSVQPHLPATVANTQIHATIEQVADFFYLDTLPKARTYAKTVGQIVLDRQTLYTLEARDTSVSLRYVGIDWLVIQCPYIAVSNRDAVFVEIHDELDFYDEVAKVHRRGFVRCLHSIEIDCCPPLKASHGIIRSAFVRSGHIFIETDTPGLLNYYTVYVTLANGNIPRLSAMQRSQCKRILSLEEHLCYDHVTTSMDNGEFVPVQRYESQATAKQCSRCTKKLHALVKRKNCAKCGHVVCMDCCNKCKVVFQLAPRTIHMCHHCFCRGLDMKPLPQSPAECGATLHFSRRHVAMARYVKELTASQSALPTAQVVDLARGLADMKLASLPTTTHIMDEDAFDRLYM
ncbi:hypothetical protein SPRG_14774 [Saprolegnia parasitica CBS 223.65]|uniref:FYVE-type domain-containing protein n=1 Tax=Saprolegnia parasitica (strain CBS 223.65) TaxID=695850 RepID=A0A067BSC6_SAPPC|nr:hypothetical protein SPRG_14774 [Saprolegnia parasitica CBS 223.65]KDO19695.1 hypothetical protein SPRG_14774 [Saprolegnia parasitica CBS 223.65]|eukprot:XP_012209611.1 hypothetical protein SPRG_14774 [Saprolegnia parasitica CBS 223.65]